MSKRLGDGKTPNIANPNMPDPNAKKVVGTKPATTAALKSADIAAPESAATIANNDAAKAVEKLEIRTKAMNANNVARVANSQLNANDEKLHVLSSMKTGKPLDKFPATSKDIPNLSLTQVDTMLSGLDADRSGNEAAKKERFRVQIGLKSNPA